MVILAMIMVAVKSDFKSILRTRKRHFLSGLRQTFPCHGTVPCVNVNSHVILQELTGTNRIVSRD